MLKQTRVYCEREQTEKEERKGGREAKGGLPMSSAEQPKKDERKQERTTKREINNKNDRAGNKKK
jgi:hypothetical protein